MHLVGGSVGGRMGACISGRCSLSQLLQTASAVSLSISPLYSYPCGVCFHVCLQELRESFREVGGQLLGGTKISEASSRELREQLPAQMVTEDDQVSK